MKGKHVSPCAAPWQARTVCSSDSLESSTLKPSALKNALAMGKSLCIMRARGMPTVFLPGSIWPV